MLLHAPELPRARRHASEPGPVGVQVTACGTDTINLACAKNPQKGDDMIEKELTIAAEFPPVSYEQWRASVEGELKGVPFEKKLVTKTLEGIDIQPLYTAKDWP